MKTISFFKTDVLRNAMRTALFLFAAMTLSLNYSCDNDDDDTPSDVDIPSDEMQALNPAPTITNPTAKIPNPSYEVVQQGGQPIVQLTLTGIQIPGTANYLPLQGTAAGNAQNIWVTVNGVGKGIAVESNAGDGSKAPRRASKAMAADLVFLVDNSGSMGEEADTVASQIVSWAQYLSTQGIDLRFGCVGYEYGDISGAINITTVEDLDSYLNDRASIYSYWGVADGLERTMGFAGTDSAQLATAAKNRDSNKGTVYLAGEESGVLALRFADENFTFRAGANRIYVDFTDEPNQPGNKPAWSVEYLSPDSAYWDASKGTVHTVFSEDTTYYRYYWYPLYDERPWVMSEYTGGTIIFTDADFENVTLKALPVTGALTNYSIISFRATGLTGEVEVTITVKDSSGVTQGVKTFTINL